MTETERANQEAFESSMRAQGEAGNQARAEFTRFINENFARANTTCDGRLNKEQFRLYVENSE